MSRTSPYLHRPWVRPSNYIGATWDGWLMFLGRNRDSDLLTNHNFDTALKALCALNSRLPEGSDDNSEMTVTTVREGHWACGWVEWIAIHPSNEAAVRLAEDLAAQLDSYPVLNEDRFSEKEHEEAQDNWCQLSMKERIDLIKRYGYGKISILAARHDWIPQNDNGSIYEALTRV